MEVIQVQLCALTFCFHGSNTSTIMFFNVFVFTFCEVNSQTCLAENSEAKNTFLVALQSP